MYDTSQCIVFHGACSRCLQLSCNFPRSEPPRCLTAPNRLVDKPPQLMPSLARYIRGIRAVGIKEWWRQMQYIGDVKAGTLVGSDQCVAILLSRISVH